MNRLVLFFTFLVFWGLIHVPTIRADITLETQSEEYIQDACITAGGLGNHNDNLISATMGTGFINRSYLSPESVN